jgi:hypothetical protein
LYAYEPPPPLPPHAGLRKQEYKEKKIFNHQFSSFVKKRIAYSTCHHARRPEMKGYDKE